MSVKVYVVLRSSARGRVLKEGLGLSDAKPSLPLLNKSLTEGIKIHTVGGTWTEL